MAENDSIGSIAVSRKKMLLSLFINPTGHHQASWLHPRADADAGINLGHYQNLARMAEDAKFQAIFFADQQLVRPGPQEAVSRTAQYIANFEPLTLIGALAVSTKNIGFIATASTSFSFPFQVARKFASLDHISNGRVGWNMVTSGIAQEAANFGFDSHYSHDVAYERGREFAEICFGLWDSWEDDAFLRDRESGQFFDPAKMHRLQFEGSHLKVEGPLNVPRSPQARPVIVQAGMSPDGRDFAARFAEIVFTMPQTLNDAKAFRDDIRRRAAKFGRNPDHVNIMPGLVVTTGKTREDAQSEQALLQSKLHIDVALTTLSMKMGLDMAQYPLDEQLPQDLPVGRPSTYGVMLDIARRGQLTLRELAISTGGSVAGKVVCDSGEAIADLMEEWFEEGGCDGFQLQPAFLPGAFEDYLTHVHPILVKRGLVETQYKGTTLRENIGVPKPERLSEYKGVVGV